MPSGAELRVEPRGAIVTLVLDRPSHRNALDEVVIGSMHAALDRACEDPSCRVIVLRGQPGVFCTGMDLERLEQMFPEPEDPAPSRSPYMDLLKRFASIERCVVSLVDGTVLAGGVGLVAASDFVIATERSTFGLSEALWGLLPAMVTPFLIRRVGFQRAYRMALTTETLDATEAAAIGLVDEVSADAESRLRTRCQRMSRLAPETIGDLKRFFHEHWILTEELEAASVGELHRLVRSPRIRDNIRGYVEQGRFPWERW